MGRISVVINTLNEEENLPKALASVKKIADEIVIVDMHSEDDTRKIAKKAGARVFKHKRTGYVEPARNYAISKAKGKWILILDADEEVSLSLRKKLKKITEGTFHHNTKEPVHLGRVHSNTPEESRLKADYYRLPRKNVIFGKWIKHSGWWPDYNIRFFKKGSVSWSEIIHSVPTTRGRGLDLKASEDNAIIHYHYTSIEQYIDRLNRYTTIQSNELVKGGYKFNWQDLIKKPSNEFLSRYFQGEGYKDGIHGLTLAGLQAFSEFVLYLKVYQHKGFKDKDIKLKEVVTEMKQAQSDINYWQADTLLKEVGGFGNRLRRKFKL